MSKNQNTKNSSEYVAALDGLKEAVSNPENFMVHTKSSPEGDLLSVRVESLPGASNESKVIEFDVSSNKITLSNVVETPQISLKGLDASVQKSTLSVSSVTLEPSGEQEQSSFVKLKTVETLENGDILKSESTQFEDGTFSTETSTSRVDETPEGLNVSSDIKTTVESPEAEVTTSVTRIESVLTSDGRHNSEIINSIEELSTSFDKKAELLAQEAANSPYLAEPMNERGFKELGSGKFSHEGIAAMANLAMDSSSNQSLSERLNAHKESVQEAIESGGSQIQEEKEKHREAVQAVRDAAQEKAGEAPIPNVGNFFKGLVSKDFGNLEKALSSGPANNAIDGPAAPSGPANNAIDGPAAPSGPGISSALEGALGGSKTPKLANSLEAGELEMGGD